MKERPILFQGAMVCALLAGTKTQTRRAVKPQPWASCCIAEGMEGESPFVFSALGGDGPGYDVEETRTPCRCPYGAPGDQLWVRESWAYSDGIGLSGGLLYRADFADGPRPIKYRPSIHMPRAASRIQLEVTGVRVERLQDISEADAMAEGCDPYIPGEGIVPRPTRADDYAYRPQYVEGYRQLWEDINGAGSWDANPWVWVVEFRRIKP
jgi:hypothetical protein